MEDLISFRDYKISLRFDDCGSEVCVLFCNGGGKSVTKERFYNHQDALTGNGVSSVNFEYLGTGKTGGDFALSSLSQRVDEGLAVIDWVEKKSTNVKKWVVFAPSMGAYIALGVASKIGFRCEKLILSAPAAYSKGAHNLLFGEGFTTEIRKPGSFQDSLSFDWISKFTGKVLLFFPENDEVVPREVFERYISSVKDENLLVRWLPETTHYMGRNGVEKNLIPEVLEFILN